MLSACHHATSLKYSIIVFKMPLILGVGIASQSGKHEYENKVGRSMSMIQYQLWHLLPNNSLFEGNITEMIYLEYVARI